VVASYFYFNFDESNDAPVQITIESENRKAPARVIVSEQKPILNTQLDAYFEIPITNNSNDVIVFDEKKMAVSCTCMLAKLSSNTVKSNETVLLRVKANLFGREGPLKLMVNLVDEKGNIWDITIKTTVYKRNSIDGDLILGVVEKGQEITKHIVYKQAALTLDDLPPPPQFDIKIPNVKVSTGEARVERITDKLFLRITNFRFDVKIPDQSFQGELFVSSEPMNMSNLLPVIHIDWKVKKD
jgi:hypothetical protein